MAVRRVAIACQGGGTHAAFTWGVLSEILSAKERFDADPAGGDTFEITAFSGTSAGALSAMAAWYGLVPNRADASLGTPAAARERLDHLWTTFAATTPAELAHNALVTAAMRWQAERLPMPGAGMGPYEPLGRLSVAGLSLMGVRPEYLAFGPLLRAVCPHLDDVDWDAVARTRLRVIAGAIEVMSGNAEIFDSDTTLRTMGLLEDDADVGADRWRCRRPLSLEGIAASGTLPEVLPAQAIPDLEFPTCDPAAPERRTGHYWDGIYSQNPPVRDLLDAGRREEKPEEIWVVRINPQEYAPATPAMCLDDIRDREGDLAGNLSLNQELDHILTTNRWLERHGDAHPPLNTRRHVAVRTIKMRRQTAAGIGRVSKVDRSATRMARLREEGRGVAARWLEDWRRQGPAFAAYPDDARYPSGGA